VKVVAPVAAFVVCVGLLFILLRSSLAGRVTDVPNERSLHSAPVPRIGGVGVLVCLAAGWLLVRPHVGAVTVACLVALAVASFIDDVRGLPVVVRLFTQGAVSFVFVVGADLHLRWLAVVPLTIAVVWLLNLYNFMDGVDGLAGGMAVIGFSVFGIAATGHDSGLAVGSLSVAAAAAGFLVYNFHPARVFLGDAGSISLGFLAAAIGLIGWSRAIWGLWFPILVFLPFIFDATVTMVKRLIKKERIWLAHKSHYYQRLVQLGWGHRRTAQVEYLVMLLAGAVALVLRSASALVQAIVLAGVGTVFAMSAAIVDRKWRMFQANDRVVS
jgi:UDP-GlcNAc:undecaprenyl-phosphate/decaprenyl-phosphate GlcNAc-1-phosphate transferase